MVRNIRLFLFVVGMGICSYVNSQVQEFGNLESAGPYEVGLYSDFPKVDEFREGTIYYPVQKEGLLSGVAISPGFIESQEHMSWWGPKLASHGFIVLTLDTNGPRDDPSLRAKALMAAIGVIRNEQGRDGSPLRGRVDEGRMAVMGHSMGGGGTLIAANEFSGDLRAAIPLTPWQPDGNFSEVQIPTLIIAGQADSIAEADTHAWPFYESLRSSIPRMYLEIKAGNHFIANSFVDEARFMPDPDVHDLVGRFVVAWLKLYLDGDDSYRELVFGSLPKKDSERISRFEYSD